MFAGNILEYNSLFNIQVKTCAWFDLSLSEVKQCKSFATMAKGKKGNHHKKDRSYQIP